MYIGTKRCSYARLIDVLNTTFLLLKVQATFCIVVNSAVAGLCACTNQSLVETFAEVFHV